MTLPPLRHVDPNASAFATTLKEAVSEGILRRAHDRLTGRGVIGQFVMGDPPTRTFAAGFLLPAVRQTQDGNGVSQQVDATSPIHLSTLGMSFQVARDIPGKLEIRPEGSVYIRILPSPDDLARNATTFGMNRGVRTYVRTRRTEIVAQRLAAQGINPRNNEPDVRERIAVIRREALAQAFRDLAARDGITASIIQGGQVTAVSVADPVATAMAGSGEGVLDADDAATLDVVAQSGEQEVDDDAAEDSLTYAWTVRHGHSGALPDESVVEPSEMPQKWLRLEVLWPSLMIDPSWTAEQIDLASAEHRDAMQRTLTDHLNRWLEADDTGDGLGGRMWAMPRATDANPHHKVLPRHVANWDRRLADLRSVPGARAVPTLRLQVEVRITDDPIDDNLRTVRVILSNRSEIVNPTRVPEKLLDRTLYLAGLHVRAPEGLHRDHILERVRPSYRWNRWLTHAGLGINCGLACERPVDRGIVDLRTTFLPSWRQPRIVPHRTEPEPKFSNLAADDGGIDIVRALVMDYTRWIAATAAEQPWRLGTEGNPEAESREKDLFENDLTSWKNELARIKIGAAVLEECLRHVRAGTAETDPLVAPLRAWRATNAAFLRSNVEAAARNAFAPSSWRLFQLAFLLSHLPGVVSRIPEWATRSDLFVEDMATDDATASLLYFPTGGGKSEAFFGLLILQAFVDRIRGKRRGVSAIVRYPLRLLTTQQANRFARVMAMAEIERRERNIGGDSFQIGFWVGGGNTPNFPSGKDGFNDLPSWEPSNLDIGSEQRLQRDDVEYQSVAKWRRLTECPFCGSKHVGLRRRKEGKIERLAHVCFSSSCNWNRLNGNIEPLPFHVMDTDIYAYAPTVLLGTVDKMAAIAQNPNTIARVFGMFGFAPWMSNLIGKDGKPLAGHGRFDHPRKPKMKPGTSQSDIWADASANGCVRIGPVFGNHAVELFDPFPALEVQDEAHLLEQSLGTFSGLFGSMLETAFSDLADKLGPVLTSRLPNGRPRRTKIIAASATVAEPERQIEMLYQRSVRVFPHPGPDLYQSFFARLEECDPRDVGRDAIDHPEIRTPTRRIYVSMPTNGRPHTSATVAVLSALHLTLTESYLLATASERSQRDRVRSLLGNALPPGPLKAFHETALRTASDDEIAEAIDLARIALCYVTSKKGGDSVQAALNEFVPRDHLREGLDLGNVGGVDTRLISGSIDIDEIQKIVERAKPSWKAGDVVQSETEFLAALRGIVATSAISHGVDIERLNLMTFAGLPSDIAEYVQASSRVGRTHVGISILVPTPQTVRDVHVVGIHDIFHRFLERMVQPAAIDRWGENAIDRILASAVQVMTCAVDHYVGLSDAPDDIARIRLWDSSGVNRMRTKAQNRFVVANQELTAFLRRAIGIEDATSVGHDPTRARFGPPARPWYDDLLQKRVRSILDLVTGDTYASAPLRTFWSGTRRPEPMTSLRDVDEAGTLEPAFRSVTGAQMARDTAALMKRLRHGSGAWAEGEGDQEAAKEDEA